MQPGTSANPPCGVKLLRVSHAGGLCSAPPLLYLQHQPRHVGDKVQISRQSAHVLSCAVLQTAASDWAGDCWMLW